MVFISLFLFLLVMIIHSSIQNRCILTFYIEADPILSMKYKSCIYNQDCYCLKKHPTYFILKLIIRKDPIMPPLTKYSLTLKTTSFDIDERWILFSNLYFYDKNHFGICKNK